jgi:hypothetical protein
MKKKERVKLKKNIENFSINFINYSLKLINSFEKVQPEIRKSVPSLFNSEIFKINSYYSEDRNHIIIIFE